MKNKKIILTVIAAVVLITIVVIAVCFAKGGTDDGPTTSDPEPVSSISSPESISDASEPISEDASEEASEPISEDVSVEESDEESDIPEESSEEESEEISEEESEEESIPEECVHEYDSGEASVFPTCKDEGQMVYTCKKCGETKTEAIPKTNTHDYDSGIVTTEATCEKEGVKTYTCKVCGDKKTESIPKTDHKYDSGKETKAATCTESGTKTYTCSVCGKTKAETIKASGHKYDSGKVIKEATCEEDGSKTYTCSVCGSTKTETISKTGHNYDAGVVTKEATTKETGITTYTCKNCGKTKTETIPKIGANPNEKASEYGDDYPITVKKTEEMEACKHRNKYHEFVVEATCQNPNAVVYVVCRDCGYKYIVNNYDDDYKNAHVLETVKVIKEATCTEYGRITEKCKYCDYEVTHDIPMVDHEYVFVRTEHVDEPHKSYDLEYQKCKHCGDIQEIQRNFKETSDHNYIVYAENKTPTATEPSYKIVYCTICDDWYVDGDSYYADGTKVRFPNSTASPRTYEDFWRTISYGDHDVPYTDYGIKIETALVIRDYRTASDITNIPKFTIKHNNGIVSDVIVSVPEKNGGSSEYCPDFNNIISQCTYIPNSIIFYIDDNGYRWEAGQSVMNGRVPEKIK